MDWFSQPVSVRRDNLNPKNVAVHAKLQISITSKLEWTHFANILGYSKPQLLPSSRDSSVHCMSSTFYIKGAGCTQAANTDLWYTAAWYPCFLSQPFTTLQTSCSPCQLLTITGLMRWAVHKKSCPFSLKTGSKCWLFNATRPPPPNVIEWGTRLISTLSLREFKPTSPMGWRVWACDRELWVLLLATCTLLVRNDNTVLPHAISFVDLALGHTTAKYFSRCLALNSYLKCHWHQHESMERC